jgi:hypothetical protein
VLKWKLFLILKAYFDPEMHLFFYSSKALHFWYDIINSKRLLTGQLPELSIAYLTF